MGKSIMNGGIEGAILRIIKNDGHDLTEEQEKRLEMLESLPKGEWIDLDENGKPISKGEAEKRWREEIQKYKPVRVHK